MPESNPLNPTWTRLLGSSRYDFSTGLSIAPNGDIYVVGGTFGSLDGLTNNTGWIVGFIAKYGPDGAKKWTRLIDGSTRATGVVFGKNGDLYVAGTTSSSLDGGGSGNGSNAFLAHLNVEGTLEWIQFLGTYTDVNAQGNTVITGLSAGPNDSVYITGNTDGDLDGESKNGDIDGFLTKFNANGTKVWTRLFGTRTESGPNITDAAEIVAGTDGAVYVVGGTFGDLNGMTKSGDSNDSDGFLIKFNADGIIEWTRLFGSNTDDEEQSYSSGNDAAISADGAIYVAGTLAGPFNEYKRDGFLSKYNSDGSQAWSRLFGSSVDGTAYALTIGTDNAIYVGGYSEGNIAGQTTKGVDGFLAKYKPDGTNLWIHLFGTTGQDWVEDLTISTEGAVYVAGSTEGNLDGQTNGGSTDAFLTKFAFADAPVNQPSSPNPPTTPPICFLKGTNVSLKAGDLPVEALSTSQVLASQDQLARIKWIGRQRRTPEFAQFDDYLPVKICAGALEENVPVRDLYLSPDHAVLVDGHLIHAQALVNGRTIIKMTEWKGDIEYYHIETENHEIIFAEGVPCETFIDNVSRQQFDNYAEYQALYPYTQMMRELPLPRVKFRRQMPSAIWRRLMERADLITAAQDQA